MIDPRIFLPLKTRVLLVVLACFFVAIWGLAMRVATVSQANLEQLLSEQMSTTVGYVAADLDSKVQMRINMLRDLAQSIPPTILDNPKKLQQHLAQHTTSQALFPTGVFIIDTQGITVADYPHVDGRDDFIGDKALFQEAMATGQVTISAPFVGRFIQRPSVAIVIPLWDPRGISAGALLGQVYLSDQNLFGQLEQTKIGKNGNLVVISPKDRLIISATESSKIMQTLPNPGIDPLLDRRTETGYEGPGFLTTDAGVETLTVSRNMKTAGWIVLAGVPTQDAFAPIAVLKREIYLVALIMSLAILAILRFVLVRQLAPLDEVGAAMRRMTAGDEPLAPLPIRGADEIGQLVDSFNHLILERRSSEEALRVSEQRFHSLFTHLSNGFALHEVIRNKEGRIIDFCYLEINPAFEKITGVTREQLIGKRLTEVMPETEQYWITHLSEVADTGVAQYFENYSKQNNRWLATHSYRPAAEQFATVVEDITERKLAEQKIELLAYHDILTELPNRRLLRDRFEQAMAHADRTGAKVALLFLDLDNFKSINDSLGHLVGDVLLKSAAARLRECVRETDTISRQGGDEFLIVLPELPDADTISPLLSKIKERLQDPFDAEGQELTTSASIGVALYPDDGGDFDTLLKKADMAMYRAKDAGRNSYQFFDEQMNIEAVEHLALRNGLRRALERNELEVHYQPQINLQTGQVVGAEALLRWNHPALGMVSPGRFIPIAEESGLIVPIGEWVLQEACRQAMNWKAAGLPDLLIAVNLSVVQFKRGEVEHAVIRALEQTGFEPSLLELEITESVLIHDAEKVLATIQRLKLLGVKLSIDDFGTGYSSLSYLKRFAVDKLKIDQSFIRDLATDQDDAAIVRAIIQMAHSLNLQTIAEGVEDEKILKHLEIFHCDEAQGYHIAKPMPAHKFAEFLAKTSELAF